MTTHAGVLALKFLIVEEIGCQPFDISELKRLFDVIAKRYEKGFVILTSTRPFGLWGQTFAKRTPLSPEHYWVESHLIHILFKLKGRFSLKRKETSRPNQPNEIKYSGLPFS
ncbi:MAG: hypothetical protein A6F72_04340 [Cycloclasticus sp. symbiont of Poecilosclerida sp. N]|nr:MAG: hypothetical protein A6F72_04340 [Cycloclasticus sp. symbiont of Poecilosclerida sp. N]